mgnify:CR=1 FL=1|tara:strand:+ start:4130 stop:4588 length:459 start_codon:yes stop_codon:yes gene_type:complete
METHEIKTANQLEHLGFQECLYSRELFYGELNDRIRQSGAYIDPSTGKIKVIRIMTGKSIFNHKFTQYVSTKVVIWNMPSWQKNETELIDLDNGDQMDVYVSIGNDLQTMQNFFAGTYILKNVENVKLKNNFTLKKLILHSTDMEPLDQLSC